MTSGVNERPYLSIGEVLGLLLEEFPDITISKIRFLESQGLIEPERTSSGYRKFFDADIERLKVILREQRKNFLPLRVIRDRLETGEIDDSGSIAVPPQSGVSQLHRGIRNVTAPTPVSGTGLDDSELDDTDGLTLDDPTGTVSADAAQVVTGRHPAAQTRAVGAADQAGSTGRASLFTVAGSAPEPPQPEIYVRTELCAAAGITASQLTELESYGIVSARGSGTNATYTDGDLAIVRAAAGFLERGIDARHLRGWRQSAEREAGLFEQRILPLLRQRNPQARHDAVQLLSELAELGEQLRQALIVSLLRHHLDA